MEISNLKKEQEATFTSSELKLANRKLLNISGVEKVYESNGQKFQLKVAGANMCVLGENLTIIKLDVQSGIIEVGGTINEIKYLDSKQNFLKKIFK